MEKDIIIPKGAWIELVNPIEISWLIPGKTLTLKRGEKFKVKEDVKPGDKYILCELIRVCKLMGDEKIERTITTSIQLLARNTRRVE